MISLIVNLIKMLLKSGFNFLSDLFKTMDCFHFLIRLEKRLNNN
jgi:hypothetical protein